MAFPQRAGGHSWRSHALLCVGSWLLLGTSALAEVPSGRVDDTVREWLAATGAPSASIAIVQNGAVAYVRAYGHQQLDPAVEATPSARYAIDSISKEFTAAAILLLAEEGKLSLDDTVAKWFPALGDASRVTLRQLLTHTSGIRDFWPQDFAPPEMLRPISHQGLIAEWVARPLDFAPGTDWQYSNSAFALAAMIVEKVSGEHLMDFLQKRIFSPLKMTRVTEDDTHPLPVGDAVPYTRQGLGPSRRAPKEGAGWLFGSAGLAMTPSDLALWDISLIDRSLLRPASYDAELEPIVLRDGTQKHYALGLDIETVQGRRRIGHGGAGSGFVSANRIWPDEKTAIIVLTNNDWADPDDLVSRIAFAVLPPDPALARAQAVFSEYQQGKVDRALFTDNGNSVFTPQALADLKDSLGPLGPPRLIELEHESKRGGMVTRRWKVLCRDRRLQIVERGYPDGKLEEFMVMRATD